MARLLICLRRDQLDSRREKISDTLHGCVTATLGLPVDKRFHRFIALKAESSVHPTDRGERYTTIENSLSEGRPVETKKRQIRAIFERSERELGMARQDVESAIHETPKHNWGIRGLSGVELVLAYEVGK